MPSSRPSSRSDASDGAAALGARFALARRVVDLGSSSVEMLHPEHADALIDEADFERDERLPYWAEVWPSAVVLARRVAGTPGAGRTLLELGCGVGLVSVAAVGAGFDVTATDYYADALAFTQTNIRRATGSRVRTRLVDWREMPGDIGRYDVVVAADVLYERRYPALIANAIALTLAPTGVALIADPGRLAAPDLPRELAARGLTVRASERIQYRDGDVRQTIQVTDVGWAEQR